MCGFSASIVHHDFPIVFGTFLQVFIATGLSAALAVELVRTGEFRIGVEVQIIIQHITTVAGRCLPTERAFGWNICCSVLGRGISRFRR